MADKNQQITIRPVKEQDVDALFDLMASLADYEGERRYLVVNPETLRRTGFNARPSWRGLIAEVDGKLVGYATFTNDFHIWSGAPRITLDDLYVSPDYRGHGLGEQLMHAVFSEAENAGACVSWTVRLENKRAISFYENLGAQYREIGKCFWQPKP